MKGEKEFQKILDGIEGWLFPKESEVLYNLSRNSKYPIVEIGAWKGKSTVCLALGAKQGKNSQIFSIDPHYGSIEHQEDGKIINTYPEYIDNLTKAGVMEQVIPRKLTSLEASKDEYPKQIGVLFIDGSHEYEDVKLDFDLWYPRVVDGGYVCLHDSDWPGVARVLREELTLDKFYNIQSADSMIIAQKKSKEEQELTIPRIPARRVMIATPVAANNAVGVYYVSSLIQSMRISSLYNVELYPIPMPYDEDEYIQVARNDLIAIAVEANVDELVWIDSDISWIPEDLFKLLAYDVDVVGGIYPKKLDKEEYPIQLLSKTINVNLQTKLFEVDGIGTGFLKMSKKSLNSLWNSNPEYKNKGITGKWICDVVVQNNQVNGEDIILCQKLRDLGYKIYLDPYVNCEHVGNKRYTGNFEKYIMALMRKEEEKNEKILDDSH